MWEEAIFRSGHISGSMPAPAAVAAVSFTGGVVVAAGPAKGRTLGVVKLPWGLLTGTVPSGALLQARRALLRHRAGSAQDVAAVLTSLEGTRGPLGPSGPWLFSFEPIGPLGDGVTVGGGRRDNAVGLFRVTEGGGAAQLGWGGVLLRQEAFSWELKRGVELRLQRGTDRGNDADSRIAALEDGFVYLAGSGREAPAEGQATSANEPESPDARAASVRVDVDLGIHEPGQRFYVDRAGWGRDPE